MLEAEILVGPLFGHGGFTWLVLINSPIFDFATTNLENEHMKQYPWNWSNWQQYIAKAER